MVLKSCRIKTSYEDNENKKGLRDFIEEMRVSASGGNLLWGGGPAYGVKSIHSKKKF